MPRAKNKTATTTSEEALSEEEKKAIAKKKRDVYRLKQKRKKARERKAALKKLEPSWKIVLVNRKKLITDVLYTRDKDQAIQKFNKILFDNNSNIRLPKKTIVAMHEIYPADYELLLLKGRKDSDPEKILHRNDIGQFEEVKTNNPKWIIYIKEPFLFEETFWVYGYHPRRDRKDYNFILNNILYNNLSKTGAIQKKVILYYNKIVIEDDNENIEIITCKTADESIRLYNEMEKESNLNKIKTIFWAGFAKGDNKLSTINKIQKKTNWDLRKIRRTSTRP
jgi:hypothetical protein